MPDEKFGDLSEYDADEIETARGCLSDLRELLNDHSAPVILVEVSGGLVTGTRTRGFDRKPVVVEIDYDNWNEGAIPRDMCDAIEAAAEAMITAANE